MAYQRLPETTQTLYAELLEQTVHAEAEAAALGVLPGTFISKTIKGGAYWYLQRMEGDRKRQHYLGRESRELLPWVEQVKQARALTAGDEAQRANLVRMLVVGGATTESAAVVKVLTLLAESGVFRRGGVLVGTQAFSVYGNMLGVRFERVPPDEEILVVLPEDAPPDKMVPALEPWPTSTSFKIRGREVRVNFGAPRTELADLIENPVPAVVVGGSGVLVNVPDPARFALYSDQRKQAADILEILLEDRPQDVTAAWEALGNRPALREGARRVFARLSQDLQDRLTQTLP